MIGRMWTASPANVELFHLRLLLLHVKGAQSYEAMRTVNGVLLPTFQAACMQMGLIADDTEWTRCLEECVLIGSSWQLLRLFSLILAYCHPSQPATLFDNFKEYMAADRLYHEHGPNTPLTADIEDDLLRDIDNQLSTLGTNLKTCNLRVPAPGPTSTIPTLIRNARLNPIEREAASARSQLKVQSMNPAQLDIYNTLYQDLQVIKAASAEPTVLVADPHNAHCYFISAAAGTGKTFVQTALLDNSRGTLNGIALATASTGIAATLFPMGQTSHKLFSIPIEIFEDSLCNIPHQSPLARLLKLCDFIIWDEAPSQHKYNFMAVDRTLRMLTNHTQIPFGGKLFIASGDFRQVSFTFPVPLRFLVL